MESVPRPTLGALGLRTKLVRAVAACAFLLGFASSSHADTLTASWNFNPEPDISTYLLSYGVQSGVYTTTIDCGNVSTRQVTVAGGFTYYFVVQAKNTQGGISAPSVEVSINLANSAPTLAFVANQSNTENVNVSVQLVGSDANGDTLTYSATGLPAEALLNPTTGLITGRLTAVSAGVHSVTATVSDGQSSTERTFTWTVLNRSPEVTGSNDFDGDLKTDVGIDRNSGLWSILKSATNNVASYEILHGTVSDLMVPGDYDGDARTDIGFYRSGAWSILTSSSEFVASLSFTLGSGADRPAPGDYDGDGQTDPTVFRPGAGSFQIQKSSLGYQLTTVTHGANGDIPVPGDYDDDGKTDLAVFRPSSGLWSILNSTTNYTTSLTKTWGVATDLPVPGDYDGDGKTDIAVFRPSTGEWLVLKSSSNFTLSTSTLLGDAAQRPVPGDYDGDRKTDVATFRPATGEWTILTSTSGSTTTVTATLGGTVSDRPIPNAIIANNTVATNDSFANRPPLIGNVVTITSSNVGATSESGEPSDGIGAGSGTPSLWWSWTAPCTFSTTQPAGFVDTIGSSFDTVLGVFTGSNLGALSLFAGDDNSGGSGTSRVPSSSPGPTTLNITAGTAYQIRVRGAAGSSVGAIVLTVTSPCTGPSITTIPNLTTNEDTPTTAVPFALSDPDTPLASLTLSASSSNTTLVPNANLVFGGSGANRTVTVTPAPNQSGTATMTVTASDGSSSLSTSFIVTVNAVNDSPTVTAIAHQTIDQNRSTGPLAFTIGDAETPAGGLTVTAASTNPALIPVGNIQFSGAFANRTISLTPTANTIGTAKITLTVSDGILVAIREFYVSVRRTGQTQGPIGSFDTPADGAAVQGSIAVTGWALDDVGINRVEIWRDLASGETTPPFNSPGHPGHGKIYIADANFVTGARPDIESAFTNLPFAYRAGWGYLLLTYGLFNQGNGTYNLYAFAFDEKTAVTLGRKTIVVNNASATLPFGSLDTPTVGGIVSGTIFNFGWALTPGTTCVIQDGQVQVGIDSRPLMPVSYGAARTDIATLFPGYTNSGNAGGAFPIDTTTLSNGVHQIGWLVTDSCGRTEGIGSRFFEVQNGTPLRTAQDTKVTKDTESTSGVRVRRMDGDWVDVSPSASGAYIITMEQLERIQMQLPSSAGTYVGSQLVNGETRALPLGSSLDAAKGIFYWQPAAGFLGAFDLEFSQNVARPFQGRDEGGPKRPALHVRIVVGPPLRVAIDTPAADVLLEQSFTIAGWALDLAAAEGSGIDAVHVWAYPATGGEPIFVGHASVGAGERRDVAAIFGEQFTRSSFDLRASSLDPGTYDLVVYPHRTATNDFDGAQTLRVTVR